MPGADQSPHGHLVRHVERVVRDQRAGRQCRAGLRRGLVRGFGPAQADPRLDGQHAAVARCGSGGVGLPAVDPRQVLLRALEVGVQRLHREQLDVGGALGVNVGLGEQAVDQQRGLVVPLLRHVGGRERLADLQTGAQVRRQRERLAEGSHRAALERLEPRRPEPEQQWHTVRRPDNRLLQRALQIGSRRLRRTHGQATAGGGGELLEHPRIRPRRGEQQMPGNGVRLRCGIGHQPGGGRVQLRPQRRRHRFVDGRVDDAVHELQGQARCHEVGCAELVHRRCGRLDRHVRETREDRESVAVAEHRESARARRRPGGQVTETQQHAAHSPCSR